MDSDKPTLQSPKSAMPQTTQPDNKIRERCYECYRPVSLCFCEAIPHIDNRTNVLILQHMGERFHAFNTARIVRKALRNCHLIADHIDRLVTRQLPIQANAGLLYPDADAPALTELARRAWRRPVRSPGSMWRQNLDHLIRRSTLRLESTYRCAVIRT